MSPVTRVRLVWTAMVLPALVASVVLPPSASAQRRQSVFVHGLASNGASWQQASDRMRNEFAIEPHRPDLPWMFRLGTQAVVLNDFMASRGLPGNTLMFGHSNGGIITRRTNQLGRDMTGLMTVGTLHAGAPLAANVRNGNVFLWGQIIARDIAVAYNTYYWYPKPWYEDLFFYALYPYAAVMNWAGRAMPYMADAVGWGTHNNPLEVSQDMVPGSAFLADPNVGINSNPNLVREAVALSERIGVASNLNHPYGITWKGIAPGAWGTLTGWQYGSAAVFWMAYEYYANYWDWSDPYYYDKRWNAWLWARAAFDMVDMDPVWCIMIGAWHAGYQACLPSDGIVPSSSQRYPGGTRQYDIYGPAHMEEKQSAQLEGMLRHVLQNVYNVPSCAATAIISFTVSPSSISVEQYSWAALSAVARNECNQVVGNQSVTWWSGNPAIASVDSYGRVYGNAPGSTIIHARHNATGRQSSASVYVYERPTPPPGCSTSLKEPMCIEPEVRDAAPTRSAAPPVVSRTARATRADH